VRLIYPDYDFSRATHRIGATSHDGTTQALFEEERRGEWAIYSIDVAPFPSTALSDLASLQRPNSSETNVPLSESVGPIANALSDDVELINEVYNPTVAIRETASPHEHSSAIWHPSEHVQQDEPFLARPPALTRERAELGFHGMGVIRQFNDRSPTNTFGPNIDFAQGFCPWDSMTQKAKEDSGYQSDEQVHVSTTPSNEPIRDYSMTSVAAASQDMGLDESLVHIAEEEGHTFVWPRVGTSMEEYFELWVNTAYCGNIEPGE
jgi:hypothetical protein